MKKLMPVGSIIYLKEGTASLVIVAITQFIKKTENDEKLTYFDYAGSKYPQGLSAENLFYFNQENVAEVVFTGYESEQHNRYLQAIEEWKEKNADSFELGKVE